MAGTLFISANVSWSAGSTTFDTMIDRTRSLLSPEEDVLLSEVFAPFEQGFPIANLDELPPDSIRLFANRCGLALQEFVDETASRVDQSESLRGVQECWQDLMDLLSADSRSDQP